MADPKTQTACEENPKVGFGAYIALALAIIIFSGVFYKMPDAYKWLGAFDPHRQVRHHRRHGQQLSGLRRLQRPRGLPLLPQSVPRCHARHGPH